MKKTTKHITLPVDIIKKYEELAKKFYKSTTQYIVDVLISHITKGENDESK